ncbi:hypothetical protein M446_4565 [Methylobacterium sp. 4-46]|uniref:hypothetical protein n=1 Tax=unclassified Methylobacterium TaxID=2615210 RepID=UPI000152DB0F|nr:MULTISPECIES: hypothetical protein [Methylobacterium]ACA18906.1 hypothetical protein M446_4565 [Methylobacterium sp. 4-46]WFT78128.1 hypothetical protein QA634_22905 [Methylobacterium nodulans]
MMSQISPMSRLHPAATVPAARGGSLCPSGGEHLANILSAGLQAAFEGALLERLPTDLASSLHELVARLDGGPAPQARDPNPRP